MITTGKASLFWAREMKKGPLHFFYPTNGVDQPREFDVGVLSAWILPEAKDTKDAANRRTLATTYQCHILPDSIRFQSSNE